MSLIRKRPAEGGNKMPGWVVSFSDMITLLLSFFIMLQAMSTSRDPELFYKGRGGFRQAIANFGLPGWLIGPHDEPDLGEARPQHPTEEDVDTERKPARALDPDDQKIRKVFDDLRRLIQTRTRFHDGPPARLMTTPVTFAEGASRPDPAADAFLSDFARRLGTETAGRPTRVAVIGLAPDADEPGDQWPLSARRARDVADRLRRLLPGGPGTAGLRIDAWGGGPGTRWQAGQADLKRTYIVLAVLEEG